MPSSFGVEKVLTSPVVIVTLRIHRSSRCSVAGLPWTPMFAIRADRLVAEHPAGLHLGHVAAEDVQIRAADRHRVDPDDRVARVLDAGIRDLRP